MEKYEIELELIFAVVLVCLGYFYAFYLGGKVNMYFAILDFIMAGWFSISAWRKINDNKS